MATYNREKKLIEDSHVVPNFAWLEDEVKSEPFMEDNFEIIDDNFGNMFLSPIRDIDTDDLKFLKLEHHDYQPLTSYLDETSGTEPKSNTCFQIHYNDQHTELKQLRVEITKINTIDCVKCGCKLALDESLYLYFSYVNNSWQFRCLPCHFKCIAGSSNKKIDILINPQTVADKLTLQKEFNLNLTFDDDSQGSNVENFKCNVCDKVLKSQIALANHNKYVHERSIKYGCGECDKTFYRKGDLTVHIRSIHTNKKIFECNICGFSFNQSSHLNRHTFSVHDKCRPFSCKKCEYTCSIRENLKRHNLIHSDIQNERYLSGTPKERTKCPLCDKTFSFNNSLKKHVKNVHDNIKTYVCFQCNRTFSEKYNLKVHINIVHLKKKKFQCTYCDRRFSVKGNLTKHLRHYHGLY